ncbi:MAG: 3-oxoacyl-[acyl-carrier protein] reductase [Sulfitobacter sp.]|jgi:3-oxoacyl-[acyl-carrier protein] reductase
MDLGLKGKRIIVTGGSRGIGKAIIETLLSEGAEVATCARGADVLNAALEVWRSQGEKVYGEAVDVTQASDYARWFDNAVEFLGGLDIFISNVSTRIESKGEQRWLDNFDVDFMQHVRASEMAIPHLQKGNDASFVFVSTIAAQMANIIPMEREYGAMKAALNAYASQLAHRLAKDGIRSNIVSPGPIYFEGGFWDQVKQGNPELYKRASRLSALQRHGTAEEVANAVVFLASPAASYITGANLRLDGGALTQIN